MKVDLFSERQRLAQTGGPLDVYSYDTAPLVLRVQISQIATAALGPAVQASMNRYEGMIKASSFSVWRELRQLLCREYGKHYLSADLDDPQEDTLQFLESVATPSQVFDIIELVCNCIQIYSAKLDKYQRKDARITQEPEDAIAEINTRLRRAGIGYQFVEGRLVRVDSQIGHAEIIVPTLNLLASSELRTVDQEFRDAFQHYRHGENDDAIQSCGKAFETLLKVVLDKKQVPHPANATAKALLDLVLGTGILPEAIDGTLGSLRAMLEQTVPTLRNRLGGHGQGAQMRTVPDYIASFTIQSTASAILLISKAAGF